MKKKNITLLLTNYVCGGNVDVTFWDGGKGNLDMNDYTITSLNDKDIIEGINDGQFGVQSIDNACVEIYENYEGVKLFYEQREYTKEQLTACKKGI